ncbi:Asp-tRNA(Asn)/Glu-tRNA(Gln) amidotransferase subunit GatA [Sporanaerobacter acetigenes]|uniref:Glutamyl-tRNA(Gln) amidotransferase subunit A n=1 Tax=Sporanaerobacter acetigenes DSM 13106 TaxID=1123281 RepID=A0A1M5S2T3_9FIRM|nr:aspartyl/glutamyl-tRNA(Asn/Gln) amidotransferase subunit A [Sporanaerobacter acetigenes DSM 13106]
MDITRLSAVELRKKLLNREISSIEIVESYYKNIEETEKDIDAFITLTKDEALRTARNIDEKIANNEEVGLLAGIPIAVKDNIATRGIKTTCGSKILENFVSPYDATVVEKIKREDAIIIGKTNMDEFAMGSSTETSYFKKTKNPHDLERVPGGSSGGSAAAVAGFEAPLSLGSETGGSVREPASFCGVVGLKPTYGLISRYGLIAFASSLDQIGPFARNVEDTALLLSVLAGYDEKDSTSVENKSIDYTKELNSNVKGMKFALPKEYFGEGIDEKVKAKVLEAVEVLKGLGAEVEEISLPYTEYALSCYYIISTSEASSNLARFDGIRYGYRAENYKDLDELYINTRSEGFGEEVKRRIMLGTFALSSGYYDAYYNKAQKIRTLIKRDFDKAFEKYDAIISPTAPILPFKIGEKINDPLSMYMSDILTVSVNLAGVCAISVPCGNLNGLPVGLQIIGDRFKEQKILNIAYTYEKNRGEENDL